MYQFQQNYKTAFNVNICEVDVIGILYGSSNNIFSFEHFCLSVNLCHNKPFLIEEMLSYRFIEQKGGREIIYKS